MSRARFFDDKRLLLRQAIVAWVLLLVGVLVFTAIAMALSFIIKGRDMVAYSTLALVTPFLIGFHIYFKRNNYYFRKSVKFAAPDPSPVEAESNKIDFLSAPLNQNGLPAHDKTSTKSINERERPNREHLPLPAPVSLMIKDCYYVRRL